MRISAAILVVCALVGSGCDIRIRGIERLDRILHVGSGARIQGSGVKSSQRRSVDEFERVDIKSAGTVDIQVGGEQSVTVEIDDNLLEIISTVVDDDTLVIESEESYRSDIELKVIVTVPKLEAVGIYGSGDVQVRDLAGDDFAVRIAGSGDVDARGSVEDVSVNIGGSGDVDLYQLAAEEVSVRIAGSGDARVHAVETLDVTIMGSGDVRYEGDPEINRTILGSGDVRRR